VLQELIETALRENQDLKIAAERVVEAAARLGFTRSDLWPQIDLSATGTRFQESRNGVPPIPDGTDNTGTAIDMDALVADAVAGVAEHVAQERAFFDRIGIDDTFAVCGVGDRFNDRLTGQQMGWGFSLADMARLGLPPVRYDGPGAYEDNPRFTTYLIRLTPEDC